VPVIRIRIAALIPLGTWQIFDLAEMMHPATKSHRIKHVMRRVRPLAGRLCKTMLHRVVVNVIDVAIHVFLTTNAVFPKSRLPNWPFKARCDM